MTFRQYRAEAAATLWLGGPLIAAQLAQISMGVVDAVMAGRLSARDLAAVAVGANMFWPICWGWASILLAVSPSVSHFYGAGRRDRIGHCVRQGLWLALIAAVAGFTCLRFTPLLIERVGIPPELIPITTGFIRAIAWGTPGLCFFQVLRSYSEGISMTRPIMYTSIIALFGNIAGDYIFMYGKLGMPRLGAIGCGVASALIMWLNAGILFVYILTHKQYKEDAVFARFELPHWPEIRELAHLGVPIATSMFMEASLFGVIALLIGKLGTNVVAGHQIALNVASVTFMIPLGIAMAITVRVGHAMGRRDIAGARRAGIVGISLAGAFMALSGVCIFAFPELIAGFYTSDPAVKSVGVTLLYMAAIFQISDGLQVAGVGALRGLKDTRAPMLITFVAYWVIGMPLGYFMSMGLGGGARAMWIGIIFGLTTAALLLNARFFVVTRRLLKSGT